MENNWMGVHISTLFHELQDIRNAVYVFNTVDAEWDRRVVLGEVPEYSDLRNILFESLVYRIVLGLSKLFSGSKEYSLLKATNQIEQARLGDSNTQDVIKSIRNKLDSSEMVKSIRIHRDKLFAHLDKENVLLRRRMDPVFVMKFIDDEELKEWMDLISELYRSCFRKEIEQVCCELRDKDIICAFFGNG